MTSANEAVIRYIAAWNETDPGHRRDLVARTFSWPRPSRGQDLLVARTWTEDGSYVDPVVAGDGHAGISAMTGKVQSRFPGYRFRLVSGIDLHIGRMRYRWEAGGIEGSPLFLAGTDFAVLAADGRFASVTGFLDARPSFV